MQRKQSDDTLGVRNSKKEKKKQKKPSLLTEETFARTNDLLYFSLKPSCLLSPKCEHWHPQKSDIYSLSVQPSNLKKSIYLIFFSLSRLP